MRALRLLCAATVTAALAAPAAYAAGDAGATLLGRAILPSDSYQPGPVSGAAITPDNGVTTPFPGQPIPGFSAVLDAGHGEFWGMPDNGYGAKGNSADFLLRLYRIRPELRTARGGAGTVEILGHLSLRDPDERVPFALTRPDRLLTGADFDLESVRRAKDGTFWFGEEFGPFLLHTDATGKVLRAPIELPGVRSPQSPYLAAPDGWTIRASRGFEPMARSVDGMRLYPMLEGALRDDPDPRRRLVYEFDLRAERYSGRTWSYRTDPGFPGAVIGDMTALDEHRFVLIERDDAQGATARQKKIYEIDLRRTDADGTLVKRLVLDLLTIADPDGISAPPRLGEFGAGDPFSFPLQSVESLEVLGGERLLIANDNNYPFSDGRWIARDKPDDTELIVVDAPRLRGGDRSSAETLAVIGDVPYGAAQVAAFPAEIGEIDADTEVERVIHLGDIKNGSSRCDDAYFAARLADFETFDDPLVYTPGDNEWTDCHRANNGGYVPTERLATLRELFFAKPGHTLGGTAHVRAQSRAFPENVTWEDAGVRYGVVHVVGSNDGQVPWFRDRTDPLTGAALPETPAETALRTGEYTAREAAAVTWIDWIFDAAEKRGAPAVVLGMQADMWDGPASGQTAFAPIKAAIADRAARLHKPVLLLQGDSHEFLVDTPEGMPANVLRVVVQGSTSVPHEWLRLKVDPASPGVFSCENVVFGSGAVTPCPQPLAP